MKLKKSFKTLIAAILCAGLISGCTASETPSSPDTSAPEATPASTSQNEETEGTENMEENSADNSEETTANESGENETNYPETIKITALSGPTSMGMTKLMENSESENLPYDFNIVGAVDEISPLIIQGNTDICCVPANLASVLFNKTEGGVKVMAINTLGVIYICENGDNTVTSVSDLKGKTIYASGKGATPEYALNYILTQNGIDPENDVDIQWKSEHAECVAAITSGEGGIAMLPQPFVTVAQSQNDGINVVLDLTEEWDKLENGSSMLTGVVIVRTEFAEQYPEAVERFLESYGQSVEYVNANVSDAAQLVEKFGIIKAAVAEKAIPKCNIVCIKGAEMKEKLSGYLGVLFEQNPQAVGGALPTDDFYYGA